MVCPYPPLLSSHVMAAACCCFAALACSMRRSRSAVLREFTLPMSMAIIAVGTCGVASHVLVSDYVLTISLRGVLATQAEDASFPMLVFFSAWARLGWVPINSSTVLLRSSSLLELFSVMVVSKDDGGLGRVRHRR